MAKEKRNIVLTGMAGAGKSTLGVLTAKALGMDFIDADILIQQREGRLLQQIIEEEGSEGFLAIEEHVLCAIRAQNCIIATGGSAVYSERAMAALRKNALNLYLALPYSEIERRVQNITGRGVVLREGNSLKDAYNERLPLYEKYADVIIDCNQKDIEACVGEIIAAIQ